MMKVMRNITAMVIAIMIAACGMMAITTMDVQASTTSTKITSSVKHSTKIVKLSKKAKKSKVVTTITTKKYSPTTRKSGNKAITKAKTVKTTNKSTYTRASKTKRINIKVATTVKTTTKSVASTESSLKASVPSNVMAAYEASGLGIHYDSSMNALGSFSASRGITLNSTSRSTFRHEMGHFVSLAKNGAANTTAFKAIYKAEMNKSTTSDYGKTSNGEYFAESFKDYLAAPAALKSNRPQTYKYMSNIVKSVTRSDVTNKWWSDAA